MEKYVAKWEQSKYLVFSSLFYFVPSIYSYMYCLYMHSLLLTVCTIISINYWRKATYGLRRNIDLFFAKITVVIFMYNGAIYVRYIPYIMIGYSNFAITLYLYYISGILLQEEKLHWYTYHMLFHLLTTCNAIIIIHSILDHHKNALC